MEIRNFCIIAHIDHGKSTLADRMIEATGTLQKREMKEQLLDMMDLERERGITIKLTPVRMGWKGIQLNLIDTPGHTDFRYEVSRSLVACEGAILLVDCSQGIQAQTLAVLTMAMECNLTIIPVLNKIDLPAADPERVSEEVMKLLGCEKEEILRISAKEGRGVTEVLDRVVQLVPPPKKFAQSGGARALIFDAVMDPYRGAVAYVRVVEGTFTKGDKAHLLGTKTPVEVLDLGHFSPKYASDPALAEGEIGYIVTGSKDVRSVRTGDTVASTEGLQALPGYTEVQPMVFAGLYPSEADNYPDLREALEKLALNDAALKFEPEHNAALGNGFRCGFLGLLHMDIVQERLEREHDCDLIITAPSVLYEVKLAVRRPAEVVRASLLKVDEPDTARISNPADFPDPSCIAEVREPWVKLEIVCRAQDIGAAMTLIGDRRGIQLDLSYLDADRALLTFEVPLQAIVLDFFDLLKSATSGYGSMSYDPIGYRAGDLVKLQILLLGESADALSTIVHRSEAHHVGAVIAKKLKEVMPKQQFQIPIQAAIGGKIVARETVAAYRKDVTGYLYGGDVTRKNKLLEKQKKGKKRMKKMGRVTLTQEAFLTVLKRS
ncbi:MAG TPA: elongation factor 4 [Candidatus Peribacter riflensis]|uniref:Elongation factor 4 n=1 Tax=Candidatus Peribacter riflensis TaxID=1735162 RepID=A0A0S1SSG7_9BACT|nr:MAG: GTP-binding protein LepA [Candidatus Peribacter riflensis]OGJ77084.1 MAG: elongation factor 4 [Candidatus Peribacteria bacterium RIFOXYB1_FULL_57_12]OGJ81843.1 MAG: elongation factor 4 [Candidatus Peribacteria bacterium RIFOXYC1_FULL_58_8]ALM11033.1 MAG: GTP-binding protein LepA [Candidatus Peribacter riflensis]ALM12136.1 MAG: GTP-binding protein LepA [Candidatus Peribacter riflensis]